MKLDIKVWLFHKKNCKIKVKYLIFQLRFIFSVESYFSK